MRFFSRKSCVIVMIENQIGPEAVSLSVLFGPSPQQTRQAGAAGAGWPRSPDSSALGLPTVSTFNTIIIVVFRRMRWIVKL